MSRAGDFWIADRRQDIALGGMTLLQQTQVLDELDATREALKAAEAKLAEPGTLWNRETAQRVAQIASERLTPGATYYGGLVAAANREIHYAIARIGLIGDHPDLRIAARAALIRMRPDFRLGAPSPQETSR